MTPNFSTGNGVLPSLMVGETLKTTPQKKFCGKGLNMFQKHETHSEIQLMSISRVAKTLSLGRDTVKSLIQEKRIKAIRIGKRLKISGEEISRFLSEESKSVEINTAPALSQISVSQFISTTKKEQDKRAKSLSGEIRRVR